MTTKNDIKAVEVLRCLPVRIDSNAWGVELTLLVTEGIFKEDVIHCRIGYDLSPNERAYRTSRQAFNIKSE